MSELNIIFYSNRCKHSIKLINLLKEKNILKDFNMILVDDNKKIPKIIKKVPTLIIKDINIPLEGNAAFNWLNTITKFHQITNNIKYTENNINEVIVNKHDFKGINQNDINNISDNYAFIDDKDIIKNNISYIKDNIDKTIIYKENEYNKKELQFKYNLDIKKHIKNREKQNIDFSKLNF
jgi:hypothetical protein